MVASIENTPTRFAMKFGVSFARTTPLPSVVDEKRLELVEQRGIGLARRDQLDEMHVARRIEEMHAAEAAPQLRRERLRRAG